MHTWTLHKHGNLCENSRVRPASARVWCVFLAHPDAYQRFSVATLLPLVHKTQVKGLGKKAMQSYDDWPRT